MAGTLFFQKARGRQAATAEISTTEVFDRLSKNGNNITGNAENNLPRLQMIFMLSPNEITPNPAQPRRMFSEDAIMRLADSIKIHGIIQPLAVRRSDGRKNYELVAGERRLRAARLLDMEQIPCVLVDANSEESAHLAIIENIQRENLNMFEQATAICSLMKIHCLTQEKIAEQLSCSQSYVANKLRLLRISEDEKEEILTASLTERHARALLRIKDENKRRAALHTMIRKSMNVAIAEEYVDRLLEAEKEIKCAEGGSTKLIIRDVRLLYNTIEHAVDTIRTAGIPVETRRTETSQETEICIRIPKTT